MAGLLDFFNGDDGQQALGLLAAAGPSMQPMNLASRLALAGQTYNALKDNQLGNQFKQAQIDDIAQQIEVRKQQAAQLARRNEMVNQWLGQMDGNVPAANQAVIDQTGNLAPTNANAALQGQASARLNAGNPLNGIPRQAIASDLAFNDGKSIGEWMFKRGVPDMVNNGGVWQDRNQVKPGESLPQMSPTGNGYQIIPDPTTPGGFNIISPKGSKELQIQNQVISSGIPKLIEAATSLHDFKQPNGQTRTTSNLQALNEAGAMGSLSQLFPSVFGAQPGVPPTAPAAGSAQLPRAQFNATPLARDQASTKPDPAILEGELTKARQRLAEAKSPEEERRAVGDISGIQREMKRNGVVSGPTTAQETFNRTIGEKGAAQVDDAYTKAAAAKQSLPALWQAQEILKAGTFTGMGANEKLNVVRALGAIGLPVPDSVANSQEFDSVLSQIVGKNIKAVVGSNGISNSDVKFVQGMFGQRGQEAKAIKFIIDRAVESNFRDIDNYNGLLPSIESNGGQSMLGKVDAPKPPAGKGPPEAAIKMLRLSPKAYSAQFDAKYGPGAAARVLGN